MKRNWKDILLTILVLASGFCICLVWFLEESLVLKIVDTVLLTTQPIFNVVLYNRSKQ